MKKLVSFFIILIISGCIAPTPEKTEIKNFQEVSTKLNLNKDSQDLIEKKGFVIVANPFNPKEKDILRPYKVLKQEGIPIFITSDSLLHIYHIQFDESLKEIEESMFYDELFKLCKSLFIEFEREYDKNQSKFIKEALRRNIAFFSVALNLLEPKKEQICKGCSCTCKERMFSCAEAEIYSFQVPSYVDQEVEKEIKLIEEHKGFENSPIFKYKEDYSQYVPRGHYTRSEKLKNYFKAMMWLGRMSFLLKGGTQILPNEEDAKIQTAQACIISKKLAEKEELRKKWEKIYNITSFYVGFADDLTFYEYMQAINYVFNGNFSYEELNEENLKRIKTKLAEYRSPKIYGGTGECGISPPFTPEQADQCLEDTKGFRFMGQRFIPDSYIFQNLVFPYVGEYLGDKKPFTMYAGIRVFPRGLDVMALLGSKRAKELLSELDDSNYASYEKAYAKLEKEFNSFNMTEWNKNLYWSWLFVLKSLLKDFNSSFPAFMQTKAWQNKELNTALASWTELRHDTILYAKQSYTMKATAIMPEEKKVKGYVEPLPEFYTRLLNLTRKTRIGLRELGAINKKTEARLLALEEILERLIEISNKELRGEILTEDDYNFINDFEDRLNNVVVDLDEKAKSTALVADVHTDTNTNMVLEEGVGYVDLILVAYKLPNNEVVLGAGPVLTYYEFKQPMSERLTDEKWEEMLSKSPPEKTIKICM